jgi:hypothetical protein
MDNEFWNARWINYFYIPPLLFDVGSIYMRKRDCFPLLVQYRGEQHLTIVTELDKLKQGIAFVVIETECQ